MTDNVVKFPTKVTTQDSGKTIEEFLDGIMLDVLKEANDSAEFLWSKVILETNNSGFSLERNSPEIAAASILILESIRSLHYLTKGIDHPLQEVAMDIFSIKVERE
jgi:hypothetical protein